MGIPRFYRFVREQFPTISQDLMLKLGSKQLNTTIDNFYIDANGIIHNCAKHIYSNNSTKSIKELELELFEAIGKYTSDIINLVNPQKLVYFAIDGVAPVSKQTQQRQRRYKSALEKESNNLNNNSELFDSTCITPGTHFMYKLDRYLNYFFRKFLSESNNKSLQIIYSSHTVPGEGEHKIVDYIRNLDDKNDLTHCMYGLDADLFMLSLGTHCPKFYLLREDQLQLQQVYTNDILFYLVNIGEMRGELSELWGNKDISVENIINDFIFICFLVGNDFLHALPGCKDLGNSIETMMVLRNEVLGKNTLVNNENINIQNLHKFFKELVKYESANICDQFYHNTFPNTTLNKSLINAKVPSMGIDINKYRHFYYEKAGVSTNVESIDTFCAYYLCGLKWVNYYYHNRPINWKWFFPYHYTPLLTDIVKYLDMNNTIPDIHLCKEEPLLPYQQLLCVVPPQSKNLLPSFLQYIYTDPLYYMFPSTFQIDLEGKQREWEGIALLPFINLDYLINSYNHAVSVESSKPDSTLTESVKNTVTNNILFKYNSKKKINYKSDYGIINSYINMISL
jgi:5'-3' exoribonuclease 1